MDYLQDGISNIEVVAHDNNNLTVVNAAKVSFSASTSVLDDRGVALIRYLAKHGHWTPFAHATTYSLLRDTMNTPQTLFPLIRAGVRMRINPDLNDPHTYDILCSMAHLPLINCHRPMWTPYLFPFADQILAKEALVGGLASLPNGSISRETAERTLRNKWIEAYPITLRVKMPIFMRSQIFKSNLGVVYNEVSRRYVRTAPQYYIPPYWRSKPEGSIKQGSGAPLDRETTKSLTQDLTNLVDLTGKFYESSLNLNAAPEQARIALPQNMYTEFWMTAQLDTLVRIMKLRDHPNAQFESQQFAKALRTVVEHVLPTGTLAKLEASFRQPHMFPGH